MEITQFTESRRDLHFKMAHAYQKFLDFIFVQNKGDEALHRSMNEIRIKFLSMYFATHAPVSPIFAYRPKLLARESGDRRYIVADYYSQKALEALRDFPRKGIGLAFEHVIPKDLMRQNCEARAKLGEVPTADEIKELLDESWHIAVIKKEEDRLLKPAKRMPDGWKAGDDALARYRHEKEMSLRFKLLRANEDAHACRAILSQELNATHAAF